MDKKYELIKDDFITIDNRKLYRIKALRDFGDVRAGDIGGYIEKEYNLSHEGNAWIYENAMVYGDAKVCVDARVYEDQLIYGEAMLYGDVDVLGDQEIYAIQEKKNENN